MNQFLFIIIFHFLADFTLQTHEQAMGKSEGKKLFNKWLFFHVGNYCLVWFIAIISLDYSVTNALIFALITFVAHYITDFITSRISKPFFQKEDYHNGFVVIGFDQVLHYVQLIYTLNLIS